MSKFTHFAKAIPMKDRKMIIQSMSEPDLREALVELLDRMLASADTSLTHGRFEHGKDIAVVIERPYGVEAIALVVKAGKLSAKSGGVLKDIFDQFQQAYETPIEVPTQLETVYANDVWIVISGSISKDVREKIDRQVHLKKARFVDIKRLEEWFTEHYPEVYFQGPTLVYLDQTAMTLETENVGTPHEAIRLSDTYVEPYLVPTSLNLDDETHDVERFLEENRLTFSKFREAIGRNSRVLVVGEPGVGKSASLRKMCVDGLHEAATSITSSSDPVAAFSIPLFIKARQLIGATTAEDLCEKVLPPTVPRESLTIATLLVDGLDEVSSGFHAEVIDAAQHCADELGATLVVSSRNIDTVKDGIEGFKRYEMLPFEFGQAIELFERMVKNPDTLEELRHALEEVQNNLALVPLSLVLLVQLAESAEEIPASVGELYNRFTDDVLGKHDAAEGVEVLWEYQVKKRLLAALAFDEFLAKDRLEIEREDFDSYVMGYVAHHGFSAEKTPGMVRDLERSAIISVGLDAVSFRHRSFLEYFCALHVINEPEAVDDLEAWVVGTYYDVNWSDVVFYYFGHRGTVAEGLLEALLAHDTGGDFFESYQRFMSARLLQAGLFSSVEIKRRGIEGALDSTVAVRDGFMRLSTALHGKPPDIVGDVALLNMAERAFQSSTLQVAEGLALDANPLATDDEILNYLCLMFASRRYADEDTLVDRAERLESAALGHGNKVLAARALLLNLWALEKSPDAKAALERKFKKFIGRHKSVLKGIVSPPKRGWRQRSRKKGREG